MLDLSTGSPDKLPESHDGASWEVIRTSTHGGNATAKHRILIADDELDMLDLIAANLTSAGFQVLKCEDGTAATALAREESPALILLDVMMPGMNGFDVCKALKNDSKTADIPIVLLTARTTQIDRIVAFELGADDYITKPFSPRELVLRVQAILRRRMQTGAGDGCLQSGLIRLDVERHQVVVGSKPIEITAIEFKLLTILMERRGRVQSRDALIAAVWGEEHDIEPRTVDTHLRRLRDKLGRAGDQIHTVRGFGYRLDDA